MTTPDYVPAMVKAGGIVTEEGGMTSHAAIVSRELGVPCVVGTGRATKALSENLLLTVDGTKGLVFRGRVAAEAPKESASVAADAKGLTTRTKGYRTLGAPARLQ